MKARHQAVAGLVAVALVAGCQDKTKLQQQKAHEPSKDALLAETPAVSPTAQAVAPEQPAVVEPPISDIELIARKAEAHAKRVDDEIQRPPVQVASTPPAPSAVEWLDDNAYRIGPAPAPRPQQQPAQPQPPQRAPAPTQAGTATQTSAAPSGPTAAPQAPTVQQQADGSSTANQPVSIDDAAPVARPPRAHQAAQVMLLGEAIAAKQLEPQHANAGDLQAALAQQIREYPRDVSAHLDYQLLQFVQGKQTPDLAAAATLPEEDQEIVSAVLDSLSNFRHTVKSDGNPLLSRKVRPLMELGERLRSRADLEVPTIQLCKRVDGFGVYEPIEQRFVAGQAHQAIVYCEIENFRSQLNAQNMWETKVAEGLVLYTEHDGLPILTEKSIEIADLCRNRRDDFFIVRKIAFPATIPVGRYLLKITVIDQLASRVAEATIPVTFVAN